MPTSLASTPVSSPTNIPGDPEEIEKFRKTKEGQSLVAWVQSEWSKAKTARGRKQLQWFTNMAMFYGSQWVEQTNPMMPQDGRNRLIQPKRPYYHQKKIINRTRSFVRWELSKFLSQIPNAVAVPASSEDQDQRAAYAAEQAWTSISEAKKFRAVFARAAWWTIVTGNGFVKTEWDPDCLDKVSGQPGDIKFSAVTPFHLFVPDLREQDIEDQPFIISAYTRPVEWVRNKFHDELADHDLKPSVSSANQILDEAYLNLGSERTADSVVVYEMWVKPGATSQLPEGGVIISVDDYLLRLYRGWPYDHQQFPFTKFEHIPTSTFYADSPLVDLNQLQKEYNQLRSEIAEAGKRMAKPGLLAARGSIVTSKITNEPGQVIEYKPGLPAPTPLPLSQLPQYYLDQQDRVLADMEEITGQRDVLAGNAPAGVTAGTAINYLQEAANQFLTTQYQSIELGHERVAAQTLELFVQYVDMPRKIRTVGADGAFDTMLLEGADIVGGTDIRIEPGSSMGKSKAANDARIMDMFATGIIQDPNMALRLLDVGGAQKIQDTLNVAEKKAQRENTKMKMLKAEEVQAAQSEQMNRVMENLMDDPEAEEMLADPEIQEQLQNLPAPLLVKVDDFDVHEVHIEVHNRFRMSQEYETLDDSIKAQFEQHVAEHTQYVQQQQIAQFLQQVPGDGTEDGGAPVDPSGQGMDVNIGGAEPGAPGEVPMEGGPSMAANGAVPTPVTTEGA